MEEAKVSEYILNNTDLVFAILVFCFISIVAIYYEWKYLGEKKKVKELLRRLNYLHNSTSRDDRR